MVWIPKNTTRTAIMGGLHQAACHIDDGGRRQRRRPANLTVTAGTHGCHYLLDDGGKHIGGAVRKTQSVDAKVNVCLAYVPVGESSLSCDAAVCVARL